MHRGNLVDRAHYKAMHWMKEVIPDRQEIAGTSRDSRCGRCAKMINSCRCSAAKLECDARYYILRATCVVVVVE